MIHGLRRILLRRWAHRHRSGERHRDRRQRPARCRQRQRHRGRGLRRQPHQRPGQRHRRRRRHPGGQQRHPGGERELAITGGGTGVSYTPNVNFNGTDSFTYTISDGNGGTDTATVSLTVTPVNDPPNAVNDSLHHHGVIRIQNATNVLANDTDADGRGYEDRDESQPKQRHRPHNAEFGPPIRPNPDFHGTDSFTYTMSDSAGATSTATVTVTVTEIDDPATVARRHGHRRRGPPSQQRRSPCWPTTPTPTAPT